MSKRIPLTQGKFAIVDDEDFEWLNQWRWSAAKHHRTYYAVRTTPRDKNGKQTTIRMHSEILKSTAGHEIDHKDGDGLNNQRNNLRLATHEENMYNRKAGMKSHTSVFKGVSWHKRNHNWQVKIGLKGQLIHLGHFVSEIEAAKIYDQAALDYFGEFAHTNFLVCANP